MTTLTIDSAAKLNNGTSIPLLGLGVYASSTCTQACLTAFDEGYRQIDTAQLYHNEKDVGEAIKQTSLPRSSLYITSKVWDPQHTEEGAYNAILESLSALQTPYIDLYLLHNPRSGPTGRHKAWLGLQRAVSEGKVKTIGVSNFTPAHVDALMSSEGVTIKPAINQIEMHPWNQQKEIVKYCRKEGIVVQAYTPIAKARRLEDPIIKKVAEKHGKTGAQVVLRWMVQQGVVVIPKSENPKRIKENAGLWDLVLDEQDLRSIEELDRGMEGNVGMWDPFAYE